MRGTLSGVVAAWLGLIALSALTSKNGASRVGGLIGVVQTGVADLLDPSKPGVPDRRKSGAAAQTSAATGPAVVQSSPAAPRLPVPTAPINT